MSFAPPPVRAFLRNVLGIEISRTRTLRQNPFFRRKKQYLIEVDPFFNDVHQRGLNASGTPAGDPNRPERLYNLAQLLGQTKHIDATVAECGVWRGLSSFILCHYLRAERADFRGNGYRIVDSFRGLSKPGTPDILTDPALTGGAPRSGQEAGAYAATVEEVRWTLREFPAAEIIEGWIPPVLGSLPEDHYRFVHLDVDFHEPTSAAIAYFYPRLRPGGILVCDDYGSLSWPGAKKAVDDYCAAEKTPLLALSTGQAVLWKR